MIEEQNDALKRRIKVAVNRYQFAVDCLGTGKRIIDLASGMGYGSYLLSMAGNSVVGVDRSIKAVEYAKIHYPGEYIVDDLETMEIGEFDAGVCMEALCHLVNPQKFKDKLNFKELVISSPIDPGNDGYYYRLHNLSEDSFKGMFKGWKIIKEFKQKKYLTLYCKKYE